MKDAKARLRRKKVYSFLDVGRVPVTNEHGNVVNHEVAPEPKTLAGYIARELAVQQAKTAAEQKARQDVARAEHDARVGAHWSQLVTELTASPVGVRDDIVGLHPGESEPTAGQNFLADLEQSGVILTESGKQRLALYCQSQWKHLGAAVTVANLQRAFERLKSLGCFADGEVIEPRLTVEVGTQEQTIPSVDAVLATTDTTTREGNALLKKAVDHQWMTELSPLISDWYEHLSRDYSIIVSREDAQYLFGPGGWFSSRGLAINVGNLNAARRHQSARGVWNALSTQEVLDQRLQRNEMSRPEYIFKVNQAHRAGVLNRPVKEAHAKGLI